MRDRYGNFFLKVRETRNRYGDRFRWEIWWNSYFKPFFEKDRLLDGGTVFWHIGFITIYKRYIHE